jgi:hypothetical protein
MGTVSGSNPIPLQYYARLLLLALVGSADAIAEDPLL